MEIIQVYHHDPRNEGKGGAVRYLNNLLKYLPQKGIKVTLLGGNVFKCQPYSQEIAFIPIVSGSNAWWKYLIMLTFKLPFMKISKKSVIHIHRIEYMLPFIIWKRKNPIVLTLHGERLATAKTICPKGVFMFVNFIYKILEYFAFKRANIVVAVSNKVKASFESAHQSVLGKIRVIPVGIDLNKFKSMDKMQLRDKYRIDKSTKVILFAGVLRNVKNVELLIRAFRHVREQYPNSLLIIVGDGPTRPFLEKLTNDLEIQSKVKFLGELPNEKMPEVYNIADVFALPSLSEGSPTVIREAISCGIPVVSTNVGDVQEIITNPLLGMIVNTNTNEKEFAKALLKTIEMSETSHSELKKKCREIAEGFGFEKVAERYIELYSLCLDRL